ncbi:DUF3419 family protein [Candidatus Peregrinibacteria bacterium]|nr:DUF3419 family protein [Candidatus Peregrinibacteria bacterium]
MINNPPIHNNFEEIGLTIDSVKFRLSETRKNLCHALDSGCQLISFTDVLYYNSSDPVNILNNEIGDIRGQSVLSIAGSGEFAQVFMNNGASKVNIIDISSHGIFYNELKLIALRNLDFINYRALFSSQDGLFNKDIYQVISYLLSPQAKVYFDTLIAPENNLLFNGGLIAKRRESRDGQYFEFMKDVIDDNEAYELLQTKVRTTDVNFKIADILDQSKEKEPNDIVYLSNIPELQFNYTMLADFIKSGSKRVLYTSLLPHCNAFEGNKAQIMDSAEGYKYIKPGETFRLDGMNARLFGFDPNSRFQIINEIRAEDNPEIIPS